MKRMKIIVRKILGIVIVLPLVIVGACVGVLGKIILAVTIGIYEDFETARITLQVFDENFLEGFSEEKNQFKNKRV